MRDLLISFVCLSLFAGCSRDERRRMDRAPIRIDDLAIPVSGEARSYMQSDRAGAFLTGVVGGSDDGDSWSVGGVEVLDDVRVEWAGEILSSDRLDSARILPFETTRYYRGGISLGVSVLEAAGDADAHAFLVRAALPRSRGTATGRPQRLVAVFFDGRGRPPPVPLTGTVPALWRRRSPP